MVDKFEMFENPHGIEEVTAEDKAQLKLLYGGKRYKECEARFSPCKSSVDIYFSYVSALQYLFLRNYPTHTVVKRFSLLHFPLCSSIIDFASLFLSDDKHL